MRHQVHPTLLRPRPPLGNPSGSVPQLALPFPPRGGTGTLPGVDGPSGLIGTSPRRKEDRRLLVGAGRYLDDLTREGLLHLGVVRSLHAHARVLTVDAREALGLPGVVAAWSAADLPEAARPILAGSEGAHKGRPFAAPVLARDVVRYVGEPVAVVVAGDPYRLADAPSRGLARQCRAGGPRGGGRCRARTGRGRPGRERDAPPRAPRRGVHRDARGACLSRPGVRTARPLVLDAEPLLDP